MDVLTDPAACPHLPGGAVVTIGAYDGVHLGHRALIGRVRTMANELGCDVTDVSVVTGDTSRVVGYAGILFG